MLLWCVWASNRIISTLYRPYRWIFPIVDICTRKSIQKSILRVPLTRVSYRYRSMRVKNIDFWPALTSHASLHNTCHQGGASGAPVSSLHTSKGINLWKADVVTLCYVFTFSCPHSWWSIVHTCILFSCIFLQPKTFRPYCEFLTLYAYPRTSCCWMSAR